MQTDMQQYVHTYKVEPRRQKAARKTTKMYLRLQDKVEVMSNCGDAALILYEFYLSKSGVDGYNFNDEAAAKALAWNKHKVGQNRRKLVKHNYFFQESTSFTDKRKLTITYLCPETIVNIKKIKDNPSILNIVIAEEEDEII